MPAFRVPGGLLVPAVACLLPSCGPDITPSVLVRREGSANAESQPNAPLSVSPDPVSLGVLRAGEKARATLKVTNTSGKSQQLATAQTTCPCIGLLGPPITIEPGQTVDLTVTFDPAEEPDFRGSLGVGLTGLGKGDAQLFATKVELTVKPDATLR